LPPKNKAELPVKLQNYYAASVVDKLLTQPCYRGNNVEQVFGRIVSDMQVRAPIRVLCRQLLDAGVPPERIMRYRVAFRPAYFDKIYPPEAGVVSCPSSSLKEPTKPANSKPPFLDAWSRPRCLVGWQATRVF
jgi:hypothetical protein